MSSPSEGSELTRGVVIIGAPKAGSTALYDYLAASGHFALPRRKETRYFVDPSRPGARPQNAEAVTDPIASYLGLFAPASRGLFLEATPDYYYDTTALAHLTALRSQLDRLVVVCVVREPVARLRSMFYFARDTIGSVPADRSFSDFARDVLDGRAASWKTTPVLWESLAIGRYGGLLDPWSAEFGADLVVVPYEWMIAHPRDLARQLLDRAEVAAGLDTLPEVLPRSNATVRPASYRLHSFIRAAARRWPSESRLRRRLRSLYDRSNARRPTGRAVEARDDDLEARLKEYYRSDAAEVAILLNPPLSPADRPDWLRSA